MNLPKPNSIWRNTFTGERVKIQRVIADMVYYEKINPIPKFQTFNKPIKTFLNTYSKCQTN